MPRPWFRSTPFAVFITSLIIGIFRAAVSFRYARFCATRRAGTLGGTGDAVRPGPVALRPRRTGTVTFCRGTRNVAHERIGRKGVTGERTFGKDGARVRRSEPASCARGRTPDGTRTWQQLKFRGGGMPAYDNKLFAFGVKLFPDSPEPGETGATRP